MGHLARADAPVNQTLTPVSSTSYEYDAAKTRVSRDCRLPAAQSACQSGAIRYVDYSYDDFGRQTLRTTTLGSPSAGNPFGRKVSTTYDLSGNSTALVSFVNGSGTAADALAFTFDSLNRPLATSRGATPQSTYAYNPDGTVASLTIPRWVNSLWVRPAGSVDERRPAEFHRSRLDLAE